MGKHIKFRLFLVVMFVFIGAVIFISEPFTSNTLTPVIQGNAVSAVVDNAVSIVEEEVAKGIPAASTAGTKTVLFAIAVTVINIAGAIAIVIMTSRDTVQV